ITPWQTALLRSGSHVNSRPQYRRTDKLPGTQPRQRFIRLGQREHGRLGPDAGVRRDLEELEPIVAGEIGDRYELPLFPERAIRKGRDVAHVDAGTDHPPALAHGA